MSDFYGDHVFNDPKYGKFTLEQHKVKIVNQINGTVNRDFQVFEVPFSQCELGRNFFYDN